MLPFSCFLRKITAVAAAALALSGCHRAEYALLPQTSPYHATYHAPAKPAPAVAQASKAAPAPAPAVAPVAPAPASAPQVAAAPAIPPAKTTPAAPPRRPGVLQKMLANKMVKKADKLTAKLLRQPRNTAEANRISGYLRTGLLLVLIGLLITILPGSSFNTIGTIVALIGVVFLVLWLLNEL